MLKVGVLGATGVIGQHYVALLQNHRWFTLSFLAASKRSDNYSKVVDDRWHLPYPIPKNYPLHSIEDIDPTCDLVFSALPSSLAEEYEPRYAAAGIPVISNASFHRMATDIPLLIPEINPSHLTIIATQQKKRQWKKGFIVVKPNCTVQSFLLPLAQLHPTFPIKNVSLTTLQAISGASHQTLFSIHDNVIPFIAGEEEKVETEPQKILGRIENGVIIPEQTITISAQCNRVPVLHGHLVSVSVTFEKKPTFAEIISLWERPSPLDLPSAPNYPVTYREEASRPQVRLDRDTESGMSVTTGRLSRSALFDWRFVALSHNTLRGGAGGGILIAELLHQKGYLD